MDPRSLPWTKQTATAKPNNRKRIAQAPTVYHWIASSKQHTYSLSKERLSDSNVVNTTTARLAVQTFPFFPVETKWQKAACTDLSDVYRNTSLWSWKTLHALHPCPSNTSANHWRWKLLLSNNFIYFDRQSKPAFRIQTDIDKLHDSFTHF